MVSVAAKAKWATNNLCAYQHRYPLVASRRPDRMARTVLTAPRRHWAAVATGPRRCPAATTSTLEMHRLTRSPLSLGFFFRIAAATSSLASATAPYPRHSHTASLVTSLSLPRSKRFPATSRGWQMRRTFSSLAALREASGRSKMPTSSQASYRKSLVYSLPRRCARELGRDCAVSPAFTSVRCRGDSFCHPSLTSLRGRADSGDRPFSASLRRFLSYTTPISAPHASRRWAWACAEPSKTLFHSSRRRCTS